MNLDQQRKLDTFVNREVIMLASQLVEDLLEISMYGEKSYGGIELDNIENLYITDEATARDYGFDSLWPAEHHFTEYGVCGSPAVNLAAIVYDIGVGAHMQGVGTCSSKVYLLGPQGSEANSFEGPDNCLVV